MYKIALSLTYADFSERVEPEDKNYLTDCSIQSNCTFLRDFDYDETKDNPLSKNHLDIYREVNSEDLQKTFEVISFTRSYSDNENYYYELIPNNEIKLSTYESKKRITKELEAQQKKK